MAAMNPSETLSCYHEKFPNMVAEKKAIWSPLKFKISTKGIRNLAEDKLVKPNSGKRKPEAPPLVGQRCKKPRMDKLECNTKRPMSVKERLNSRLRLMNAKPRKGCSSMDKTAKKGNSDPSNLRRTIDFVEARCPSCLSGTTHCLDNVASQTSASDISSDVLKDQKSPHATPASSEGWRVGGDMSPKKALRVAMLKKRFADTIFKAKQTVLHHGEKSGLSRTKEERERIEKEELKERARTEVQIKSAEAALRRQEQHDLKMRIQQERKAARMALEKMERSVELYNSAIALKDLEILFGLAGRNGYPDRRALARLGLYRKDEVAVLN